MRILGIDPGLATVGYGVIEYHKGTFTTLSYGSITTPAHTPVEMRLKTIHEDLDTLIKRFSPDEMAIEELFFNQNITTAITVAEARGVMIMTAAENGVPVFEYTPLQVKQAVVGYGRAQKIQIQQMVKAILSLGEIPKPDDVADALAIAVCHAHSYKMVKSGVHM